MRLPGPDYADQFYHIFNIGFDSKNIFKRDLDYKRFLSKLEDNKSFSYSREVRRLYRRPETGVVIP